MADGGTPFLDEIGNISLTTQTNLLRVLQEKEIVRVGGTQTIKVDFRCVAATNKDLQGLVDEGPSRPVLSLERVRHPPAGPARAARTSPCW